MSHRIVFATGAVTFMLAFALPERAPAGSMRGQAVFGLWSFDASFNLQFRAAKWETYQSFQVHQKLRDLRSAAIFDYAPTDGGFLPDLASDLFLEGFIVDPIVFYNTGDSDPTPTTIDNDVPDGPNSAQISFSFPGAGIEIFGSPSSTVLFEDNSANNNAGLGKYYATLSSSIIGFEPAVPRSFSQIALNLLQSSETNITRIGGPPSEPFSFDIPADTVIDSLVGPHRFDLRAEGTVTQELLDVYAMEGFGSSDSIQLLSNGGIGLPNTSIIGPASSSVEVSAYFFVDALVSTPIGSNYDFNSITVSFTAHDNASTEFVQNMKGLAGNQIFGFGFSSLDLITIIDHRILLPGDPDYAAGMTTTDFRLVAHLPILLDTSKEYYFQPFAAVLRTATITPDTVPGNFARVSAQVLHPITPDQTQVKLYVPAGYSLLMNDSDGPNDLILPVIKGDSDLDGIIGPVDQAALIAAYTGSLGGNGYSPADPDDFATFDFEGDGDVDCADHQSLLDTWSAGSSPSVFPDCDNDSDSDGIPNADDDCAGTPAGASVSETGCLHGDFNQDGFVGGGDSAGLADCMEGQYRLPNPMPPVSFAACLNSLDLDDDNDVDLEDYAMLQRLVP